MTDLFLKIKAQLQAGYPFAVFSKPGSNDITGIFQATPETHYLTDYDAKGFVFAPFEGEQRLFIPVSECDIISAAINTDGFTPAEAAPVAIDADAKIAFETLVSNSVAAIKSGSFKKLVTSRTETTGLTESDITIIYKRLLYTYPNAYKYCFYTPESGLWMGATPEQLLKVENKTLHTVALAGTQVYTEGETAIWENKEKEEQQFVTDYILNEVKSYVANINTTEPYTFRAGNLVHIKTDISAELKEAGSLQNVINTLHPTPAVCGLPKNEAKKFLRDNEGYNREYYAGFLGEINIDIATGQPKTDLFVNLRCMKLTEGNAQLFIGCGITKDSNPEKEFFETVNKSMTMRKVI
jgi:isochorismate synthase